MPHAWGLDAHGQVAPPSDGDPAGPLFGFHAGANQSLRYTTSLGLEFVQRPLVEMVTPDSSVDVLQTAWMANLHFRMNIISRLGVGVTLPVAFRSTHEALSSIESVPEPLSGSRGLGLGDAHLWVPVSIVETSGSTVNGGVLVVPWMSIPTGSRERYLGDVRPNMGAWFVGSLRWKSLVSHGQFSPEWRGNAPVQNLPGGPGIRAHASVGWVASELLALHLEMRLRAPFSGGEVGYVENEGRSPVEAFITARGRHQGGFWYGLSAGTAVRTGVGAGDLRVQALLGYTKSRKKRPVPIVESGPAPAPAVEVVPAGLSVIVRNQEGVFIEGTVRVSDANGQVVDPVESEWPLTVGEWTVRVSAEGYGAQSRVVDVVPGQTALEPLELVLLPAQGDGTVEFHIVGGAGTPPEAAVVEVEGRPVGSVGSGGKVRLEGLSQGSTAVKVSAEGHAVWSSQVDITAEISGHTAVLLRNEPGFLQVTVRDDDGAPVDASVRFLGAGRLGPFQVGADGRRAFVLRPGEWTALVSSPTLGVQEHLVVVPEMHREVMVLDVVLQRAEDGLADLTIRAIDSQGYPVERLQLSLSDLAFGTTGNGGRLTLKALQPGPRTLSFEGEYVEKSEPLELMLTEGKQEVTVVASWLSGTTRISAQSEEGVVRDGRSRFSGPEVRPPLDLGTTGVAYTRLVEGDWELSVSSPRWGMRSHFLQIQPTRSVLHRVDVVFPSAEDGQGVLSVQVLDLKGESVQGAQIFLDDQAVGWTDTRGTLQLTKLRKGTRRLQVVADFYAMHEEQFVVGGKADTHEVLLQWKPAVIEVFASAQGTPVQEGMVRVAGAEYIPAAPLNPDGRKRIQLTPGIWEVVFSSGTWGMHPRTVQVQENKSPQEVHFELTTPRRFRQVLRVIDEDGEPVLAARLERNGETLAAGPGGLFLLEPPSEDALEEFLVRAPHFQDTTLMAMNTGDDRVERTVVMSYSPVSLAMEVVGPSGVPVESTVRFLGPEERQSETTDLLGKGTFLLRPGVWDVLVSAPDLGVSRRRVEIRPGTTEQTLRFTLVPAKLEVVEGRVRVKEKVYFALNRSELGKESLAVLQEAANLMVSHPEWVRLEIQGHTDGSGDLVYNQALSSRRAEAVMKVLVKMGVAPERLRARGYGRIRPVATNETEEGRQANRRVEFEILETGSD